jgi:ATP-dependent DNA helicase RecG
MPPVPARNRRIGEFLKELRLAEGRGTGLPKIFRAMRDNGSQEPSFDFDEERTYFRVTLPAHPEYIAISALRDAAHLKSLGNEAESFVRIEKAWGSLPSSPSLAAEYIRRLGERDRLTDAESVFLKFKATSSDSFHPFVTNVFIEVLLDNKREEQAKSLLDQQPQYLSSTDALESAILARRLNKQEKAHRYFERAGDAVLHNVRALHEFAQTKIKLAQKLMKSGRHNGESNRRLLLEAKELLERSIQMEADKARHAWAWRDLGRVKKWLKYPQGEVIVAYHQAIELLPNEERFKTELSRYGNLKL